MILRQAAGPKSTRGPGRGGERTGAGGAGRTRAVDDDGHGKNFATNLYLAVFSLCSAVKIQPEEMV